MIEPLRDREHLVRMAALFAAGVALFVIVRSLLVPEGFGMYGHYRAGALDDVRYQVPVYAGQEACAECHDDVAETRVGGAHAGVACETCHGPLAVHAADPAALEPVLPDAATICLVCHQRGAAKPRAFPQVDAREHAEGEGCDTCHDPHSPEVL